MGQTWDDFQKRLAARNDVFDPLRELVQWHFADAERIKLVERPVPGYERRPTIGLRLQLPGKKTLAIRPGWSPPRRRHAEDAADPRRFGKLHLDAVTLELLGPGKLLTVTLTEGKPPRSGNVFTEMRQNVVNLDTILSTAHDLLMDPMEVFSRQADRCCCCSKPLTDVVSRTRGIGPECVRKFGCFKLDNPPTAVDKYRRKYLVETGFLPGR